jgi:hypothetical protein
MTLGRYRDGTRERRTQVVSTLSSMGSEAQIVWFRAIES